MQQRRRPTTKTGHWPISGLSASSSVPLRSDLPAQTGPEAAHRTRSNSDSSPDQPPPKRVRIDEEPLPERTTAPLEEDENPLPPAGGEDSGDEPEAKRTRVGSDFEPTAPLDPIPDEVGLVASVDVAASMVSARQKGNMTCVSAFRLHASPIVPPNETCAVDGAWTYSMRTMSPAVGGICRI